MAIVPLKNVSEIHTPSYWYDKVSNVEEVYLSGKQFLRFTHMSRATGKRETVCVASETILKFDYYNKTPELKNRAEVHEAFKAGHLVGY